MTQSSPPTSDNKQIATVETAMNDSVPKSVSKFISGSSISPIIPQTIEDAMRLARAVCVSGMVPDSLKGQDKEETAAKVMMTMMKGMELRRPPIWSLTNIFIVNNRPCVWGDGALDLVITHPRYVKHREWFSGSQNKDDWTAHTEITFKLPDGTIQTEERTFSWAEAKAANLIGKNVWKVYPQRMLKMRARAWAMRDLMPDALAGLGMREELEDVEVKKNKADAQMALLRQRADDAPTEQKTNPDDEIEKAIISEIEAATNPSQITEIMHTHIATIAAWVDNDSERHQRVVKASSDRRQFLLNEVEEVESVGTNETAITAS